MAHVIGRGFLKDVRQGLGNGLHGEFSARGMDAVDFRCAMILCHYIAVLIDMEFLFNSIKESVSLMASETGCSICELRLGMRSLAADGVADPVLPLSLSECSYVFIWSALRCLRARRCRRVAASVISRK